MAFRSLCFCSNRRVFLAREKSSGGTFKGRHTARPITLIPLHPYTPAMQRQQVESTNIKSVGYDAEQEILEIEFQNDGVYHYVGVPPVVYEGLLSASSKGRYFGEYVRERYPYEKVR
jgi:hypothetical protein